MQADLTVTFVGLKAGLFLNAGPDLCGDIVLADLDVPDQAHENSEAEFRRITDTHLDAWLPPRPASSHKGDFGHVLVVGGGPGMPGAVRLCGEAALRCGAGLVSIATHPDHAAIVVAARPELMPHAIADADDLVPLLQKADVVAFGPGLGRSSWAGSLVDVLADDERPTVWDADALNWLAESPAVSERRVITPHPGEAARLLGSATEDVQRDRRTALQDLETRYGGVVVLKGAGSLVSGTDGAPWLCTSGNPGMASAGMGDVLTGVIAGLVAQGLSLEQAAAIGVEIHARAGDIAAQAGERGLLASDLLASLRGIVNP